MSRPALNVHRPGVGVRPGIVDVDAAKTRILVTLAREPMTRADWKVHDYNLHFCVGFENAGEATLRSELAIEGGEWEKLPDIEPILYESAGPHGPYRPSRRPGRTDLGKRYAIRLVLAPGETVYLANYLPVDGSAVVAECDGLAIRGGARRRVFGRSVEGRDLVAYVYGDPAVQGTVLVTAGFHPPEPDTLAAREIMEWLAASDAEPIRKALSIVVVPVANPDGFAKGTQAANANGINFYWDFAWDRADVCPEAAALWTLASTLRPRGYIDYHGYTFQRNKEWGPYVRPGLFYSDPRVRTAAEAVYRRLGDIEGARTVTGFAAYAPQTLGSMLADAYDTITLAKFHVHLKDGAAACRTQGLTAFRTLAEVLTESTLTAPGQASSPGWRLPVRRAREIWAGWLRPSLGLLRRGRLREINFSRGGLVLP